MLNLGAAIAAHGVYALHLRDLNRFLDDLVIEELEGEYRRLAADLDLLEGLSGPGADSPDIEPLASALIDRIRALLEREQRIFYQPLLRLALSDGAHA